MFFRAVFDVFWRRRRREKKKKKAGERRHSMGNEKTRNVTRRVF
jgi:hypothetical protein